MPNRLPFLLVCAGVIALAGVGCKAPEVQVLRQEVPVSSVPVGARVLVNGQPAGQTPTVLSLERTRDHIVTLLLEPYRQEDIVVRHLYQQERTMVKALQSGLDAGLFFKDARMGVGSAMNTSDRMEATGEAFRLAPPAISVTLLRPGAVAATAAAAGPQLAPVPEPEPVDRKALAREVAIAGVAVAAAQPKVGRTWEKSSDQTTVSKDGKTVTRTETKTSTSVKVGVSAQGVASILETLFK